MTSSLFSFGISIPTVFFPGIIETLAEVELVFLARSSERLIIFETFTPGAGSNSYKLTTGPLLIFLIFPSIPKSRRIFSMKSLSGRFLAKSEALSLETDFSKSSIEGRINFLLSFFKVIKIFCFFKEKTLLGVIIVFFFSVSISKFL